MINQSLIVLGDTGNFSRSIQQVISKRFPFLKIILIPTIDIKFAWKCGSLDDLLWINLKTSESKTWIINTCGITDPNVDEFSLFDINVSMNSHVARFSASENIGFVSLGTVMEVFPEVCEHNNYLKSKLKAIEELSLIGADEFLHLRLHTLYGGKKLPRHMFLSQLFYALMNKIDFEMSSGLQIRQYHHFDDLNAIVIRMIMHNLTGIHTVSSGESIKLIDLATEIYSKLLPNKRILPILPSPKIEQYDGNFPAMKTFDDFPIYFRNTVDGVIDYFNSIHTNIN